MASAGVQIDESTHVPGRSAGEVSSRIVASVTAVPGHHCATVGPGVHTVVRGYRLPLRFLRNRTDVCTITVVDAPLGAVVTTIGALVPEARAAVDAAVAGTTPAPAPRSDVTTIRPRTPETPVRLPDVTSVRPRPPAPPPVAPPAPAPVGVPMLRFDTGQVVPIGGTVVVVGRNPVALESDPHPQLVGIADPAQTVSKTHFACGQDERGVWVEDRHSTNGTTVTDARGRRAVLLPGRRTRVPLDVTIMFGDRRVALVSGP